MDAIKGGAKISLLIINLVLCLVGVSSFTLSGSAGKRAEVNYYDVFAFFLSFFFYV